MLVRVGLPAWEPEWCSGWSCSQRSGGMPWVEGLSVRALADRHGVHRRTVRQVLVSAVPPGRKTPVRSAPVTAPWRGVG